MKNLSFLPLILLIVTACNQSESSDPGSKTYANHKLASDEFSYQGNTYKICFYYNKENKIFKIIESKESTSANFTREFIYEGEKITKEEFTSYIPNESGIYYYSYNNDHISQAIFVNNSSRDSTIYTFEYNSSDQVIKKAIVNNDYYTYEYDKKGNVTSEKHFLKDGSLDKNSTYTFKYDNNKNSYKEIGLPPMDYLSWNNNNIIDTKQISTNSNLPIIPMQLFHFFKNAR